MHQRTRSVVPVICVCGLAASASAVMAQEAGLAGLGSLDGALQRVYPGSKPKHEAGGGVVDAQVGPDVTVGELIVTNNYIMRGLTPLGSNTLYYAYGLGTVSCNVGDQNVLWQNNTAKHPVIPQNMYKMYTAGGTNYVRFEQIGQSWCKHAFTALTQNACGTCNGQGGAVLGIGCSDPYVASRNGSQANATGSGGSGPRWDINPYTGVYPWPIPAEQATTDGTSRRIRVLKSDLVHTNATSATQYVGEAMYVNWDDARYGNGKNNASYRRMFYTELDTSGNASPGSFDLEGVDGQNNNGIHRQRPAIYAWKDYGNNNTPDANVMVSEVSTGGVFAQPADPTGDGWNYVASKATDNGNGTWHYEYAVENVNSDRGVGSFTVPIPTGVLVTNVGWHGVDTHSEDTNPADQNSRNAAWTIQNNSGVVAFSSPVAYDGNNRHGNFLRWGTLYNFRFDANVAPVNTGQVTLGFYKPMSGWPASINAGAWVPGTPAAPCYANCDASTTSPVVNTGDFTCFLQQYSNAVVLAEAGQTTHYANCDGSTVFPEVNTADFTCFLQKYAAGCT